VSLLQKLTLVNWAIRVVACSLVPGSSLGGILWPRGK